MRTLANGKVILSNLRIILFRNVKAEFDLECFYFRVVHAPVTEEKTLSSQPLHRELSLILKEIKVITDKIREDDEAGSVESDWKFAAMVIDRICLIAYTFFTIMATVAVLHAAPHVIVA